MEEAGGEEGGGGTLRGGGGRGKGGGVQAMDSGRASSQEEGSVVVTTPNQDQKWLPNSYCRRADRLWRGVNSEARERGEQDGGGNGGKLPAPPLLLLPGNGFWRVSQEGEGREKEETRVKRASR